MQDGFYFYLGQLAAMTLVHGGGAINILCPSVYNFLSGMSPSDIIVAIDEIPEEATKQILRKVSRCMKVRSYVMCIEGRVVAKIRCTDV